MFKSSLVLVIVGDFGVGPKNWTTQEHRDLVAARVDQDRPLSTICHRAEELIGRTIKAGKLQKDVAAAWFMARVRNLSATKDMPRLWPN